MLIHNRGDDSKSRKERHNFPQLSFSLSFMNNWFFLRGKKKKKHRPLIILAFHLVFISTSIHTDTLRQCI